MNGATAEPFATTRRRPTRSRTITIGASQYFLFSLRKSQKSDTTWSFDMSASERPFVVPGVAVPRRIWVPGALPERGPAPERVAPGQPADDADRGHDEREDHEKDDARHHEPESVRQRHPEPPRDRQRTGDGRAEQEQQEARGHEERRDAQELPPEDPP